MKKIIIGVVILVLVVLFGYFFFLKPKTIEVAEMGNGSGDENIKIDSKCEDNNIPKTICEDFLNTWYTYHTTRLSLSKEKLDKMTTFLYFSSNSTASSGLTLYRVDYYVNYGDDIRLRTHDSFPLNVSPKVDPPYPSVKVPRDNTHLSNKDLEEINKANAWYSNITLFPIKLSYQNKGEIVKDIKDKYSNKGAVSISYSLSFNERSGEPIADLFGAGARDKDCYSGKHNLITKTGELERSGPCQIY